MIFNNLAQAVRLFLSHPDTGFSLLLSANGTLTALSEIRSINDFQSSTHNFTTIMLCSWIRGRVGGEYRYCNNWEVCPVGLVLGI